MLGSADRPQCTQSAGPWAVRSTAVPRDRSENEPEMVPARTLPANVARKAANRTNAAWAKASFENSNFRLRDVNGFGPPLARQPEVYHCRREQQPGHSRDCSGTVPGTGTVGTPNSDSARTRPGRQRAESEFGAPIRTRLHPVE